jgi:serine/threonine protein kinase
MDFSQFCPNCFEPIGAADPCPACGYTASAEGANLLYLKPGTQLAGKYMVGQVLGQGGFGITCLGWDMNLDVKLAIKEFFPQGFVSRQPGADYIVSFASTAADEYSYGIERFLYEAKTLSRFEDHPNTVSVRDFFRENNTAYMIMSFVEGITFEK